MNSKMKKLILCILSVIMIVFSLSACSSQQTQSTETSQETQDNETVNITYDSELSFDLNDMFTERDLKNDYDESEAETITLADGNSSSDSANVTIDGDTLTITDEGIYIISGSLSDGQIIVNAEESDKVQLVLNNVSINSSSSAAIYVIEADKVFITTAQNTENTLSNSGEFQPDGETNIDGVIFSKSDLTMNGTGTLTVSTNYGNGIVSKDDLKLTAGTYHITVSGKGLEANDSIRIADGTYNITSDDDALHSNLDLAIIGGTFQINSGDDGIHADFILYITGGSININESYEGIEASRIYIVGGNITVKSSDDGLNAAGGNDQSGYGSMMDEFSAQEGVIISISGGTLNINAEGDGVDSNGDLEVSGGETYVSGPTNSGNGALDYNGTGTITGGTFIAVGASGMAMNFSSAEQGSILVNFNDNYSNQEITVTDSNGNTVLTYTNTKSFNSILVSSPELKTGETYTVSIGDTYQTVTLEDNIYGTGSGMGMGGGMMQGGGMPGGFGGPRG